MKRLVVLLLALALTWLALPVLARAETGVLDVPIRAGSDDAEQRSSSTDLTSSDLELVQDGTTRQTVGLRFTGVTVPPGATVTRAYIQFTVDRTSSTTVPLTIHGQAADNPPTFTTASTSVTGRTRTAASVAWSPAAWTTAGARGPAQQTADLSAVVQEIVNRSGWASGNAMAFILTGSTSNKRVGTSYNGASSRAPALHMEWSTGTNLAPVVDAGADQAVQLPNAATLAGTVTDDGLPAPARTTITWSKVSGPGTVTFADPSAARTTAAFGTAGTYVLRLTAGDGALSASDDVTVTAGETSQSSPPPPAGVVPTAADYGFPGCTGAGRSVVRPFPQGTVLTSRWRVSAPPDDTTYDLTGVVSTAFPSTSYPFSFGTGSDNLDAGLRTCMLGGELRGQVSDPPEHTWDWYHDFANASCVKGAAYGWYQIHGTRCDGVEDGFRTQEPGVNANNARFLVSGTYLTNVLDDCLENDYTVGGVLLDNLWEECYTGISERPSGDRCWITPPDEQLIVDHMLIGLRSMQVEGKGYGPGGLFKWSDCAGPNQVVIKCSVFLVHAVRLSGVDGMAIPAGTVVDDSACPDRPTTIVWLGGGAYPGDLQGLPIRVTSDRTVWDAAVAEWKARHGY